MRRELINEAFGLGVDPDRIQACVSQDDEDSLSNFIAEHKQQRREEEEAKVEPVPETEDEARKLLASQEKVIGELTSQLAEGRVMLQALLES